MPLLRRSSAKRHLADRHGLFQAVAHRGMKCVLTAFLLALAATSWGTAASPPELTLTRDGRPQATSVLRHRSNKSAQFAAVELQYHLKKITGETLPVVTDGQPVEGTRILVGDSNAARGAGAARNGAEAGGIRHQVPAQHPGRCSGMIPRRPTTGRSGRYACPASSAATARLTVSEPWSP